VGGVAIALAVLALPVAGWSACALLTAREARLAVVVGAVALALGLSWFASWLGRQEPWRRLLVDRLWTFEAPADPRETVAILVRDEDAELAAIELRRARLNPATFLRIGSTPPDAPALTVQIQVQRPTAWPLPNGVTTAERIRGVLSEAGFPARVASVDVGPRLEG
jgi:hypothetical protein